MATVHIDDSCLVISLSDVGSVAEQLRGARRIHVTGNVAAGKSTVARSLGRAFGLPVVHMDHMVWAPGWVKRSEAERQSLLEPAISSDAWVIDGVSEQVRRECDALVFIDLPTRVAMRRALSRIVRLRGGHRPELAPEFPEWRAARPALRLARRFNRHVRPGIEADLAHVPVVVRLTSVKQVLDVNAKLLRSVGA